MTATLSEYVSKFKKAKNLEDKDAAARVVYRKGVELMNPPWANAIGEKDILSIYEKAGFTRDEIGAIVMYHLEKILPE